MSTSVIEVAEAECGWSVRWKQRVESNFPDAAAAVRYAQRLSSEERQAPRVRVYFAAATGAAG
jgi:hypothetical protein